MAAVAHDVDVGIVGLGLIGGSVARALAPSGHSVRGWTASEGDRDGASAAGLTIVENLRALGDANIIVIAVPIGAIAAVARELLALSTATVLHVGGLQRQSAVGLTDAEYARVIGTHPIAGSHESGFSASRADLFRGATVSAEVRAPSAVRAVIERLWMSAGAARVEFRDADEHDALVARVSHVPQLAATALAATLAQLGVRAGDAGPGARDTTRLAASDLAVWRDALLRAPIETIDGLRALEGEIATLRASLEQHDLALVEDAWAKARAWRQAADVPR